MIRLYEENIKKLMTYCKKKEKLTPVGLNDSQLVNVTNPWKKGFFDLLVEDFKKEGINYCNRSI